MMSQRIEFKQMRTLEPKTTTTRTTTTRTTTRTTTTHVPRKRISGAFPQQNVLTFDKDAGDILQAINALVLKWKQLM